MLDLLFQQPLLNVNAVATKLGLAYDTANKLVRATEKLGLIEETTGGQRNRRYRYSPYMTLFEEEQVTSPETTPRQTTDGPTFQGYAGTDGHAR